MALRLYLTNSAAPYTPATVRGTWSDKVLTGASGMLRRKTGSGTTAAKAETSTSASWSVLLRRFVSEPVNNPGTLSGVFNLCAGWLESNADANMVLQMHMYVIAGSSDTVRGALTSLALVGTVELPYQDFGLGAAGIQTTGPSVTPVAVLPGDRIVIELGFRATNTISTSRTGTLYYGGTASDLEGGNQFVTTRPGWVEFADESFHDAFDIPFRSGNTVTTLAVTSGVIGPGKYKEVLTGVTTSPVVTALQGYKVAKTFINSVRPPGRPPGHPPEPELGSFTTGIRYQGSELITAPMLNYAGSSAERIPTTVAESILNGAPKIIPYAVLLGDHDISPPDVDLITAPPAVVPQSPVRFIAQDIRTHRFLTYELPLIDVQITWTLSGPTVLQAKLHPESPSLRELGISAWATWIHIEQDGQLLGSVIWQPTKIDGEEYTVEGIGFSGYAQEMPFWSEEFYVQTDVCDVMRRIWSHLESYPDARLGVSLDNTMSGLTLGLPPFQKVDEDGFLAYDDANPIEITPPTPGSPIDTQEELKVIRQERNPDTGDLTVYYNDGAVYLFKALVEPEKPYILAWYNDTDCGQEFDNLAKTAKVEYREVAYWATEGDIDVIPVTKRRIEMAYPRLGRKRFELRCAQDENMIEAIPLEEATGVQGFASQVMARGVGEGRDAIRGYAGQADVHRVRRVGIVVDGTLMTQPNATAYAADEYQRRRAAVTVGQVVIKDWHPNCPVGSFMVGDELLITGYIPWAGYVEFWHRIISYTWQPAANIVTLDIRRGEQFAYGKPLPVPPPVPAYPWVDYPDSAGPPPGSGTPGDGTVPLPGQAQI